MVSCEPVVAGFFASPFPFPTRDSYRGRVCHRGWYEDSPSTAVSFNWSLTLTDSASCPSYAILLLSSFAGEVKECLVILGLRWDPEGTPYLLGMVEDLSFPDTKIVKICEICKGINEL